MVGEIIPESRATSLGIRNANEGDINLDIFEDFYPDQAHFVYELLQNAEDAGATEACFTLKPDGCQFHHNGTRLFTEQDVRSITGIHNSTKSKAADQIGKFGVGFKSVFVYSQTPEIHSGEFSFRIRNLVMPEPIDSLPMAKGKTCFWLPFNSPKKSAADAFAEVQNGLRELAETTLIFLPNLGTISWSIHGAERGAVLREQHSEFHIEVLKETGGRKTASSHFLKFERPVKGLEKQRLSIAFALDFLPGCTSFDRRKPLREQLKIVEAAGKVAVYFPAEKETSGLRFHLHAPFVPELSRASIKETPSNLPLFEELAELTAASLPKIRDLGLLTLDFLGVLPNPQDQVPDRYKQIEAAIIAAMKTEPLTPTYNKSHAPAASLIQARAALKELLSLSDLRVLLDREFEPQWAAGATKKNSNVDRFLDSLEIEEWSIDEFVDLLEERCSDHDPDSEFLDWLSEKSPEWHQSLYALLYSELEPDGSLYRVRGLQLIRLAQGGYSEGAQCFFPSEDKQNDDSLPRVDVAVYTSGKSKLQQQNAYKFLVDAGVREVGEYEQIEAILKKRYCYDADEPDEKLYLKDLRRFIKLVETQPSSASLFAEYWIFQRTDGNWACPSQTFLDKPFLDTGLSAYYDARAEETEVFGLSPRYLDCGIPLKKIAAFAKEVGALTELEITQTRCQGNPAWSWHLSKAPGSRQTSSSINRDYFIEDLDELLKTPNLGLSRLVWRTMCSLPGDGRYLSAFFRWNASSGARFAPSQLVCQLRKAAWVPQQGGTFVRPAEADASSLPEGFPFDPGWKWLKEVEFGQSAVRQEEAKRHKHQTAKAIGFSDENSLERALRFAALPADEQEKILDTFARQSVELPNHEPVNPIRRAERVSELASIAPDRVSEERKRSVSLVRESVKEEASRYLIQQYESDGELICQLCKGPMPFKLDNGDFYFETVEFLPQLKKHHFQNYLALCPNHRAMFKHANASAETMIEKLGELVGNELEVIVAQKTETIYFTKTHIADLRAVIDVDQNDDGEAEDEFSEQAAG